MESTLAVPKVELERALGVWAGFGRGESFGDRAWSDQQQSRITDSVNSGLRSIYFCGYDWSFLHPVTTLSLAESGNTIDLPDDFGGLEGSVTVASSDAGSFEPLKVVGEGAIRAEYARTPSMTGRPGWCAVRPIKGTTALSGQRFQLYVYPTANAAFTLSITYYILPNALKDESPYAYGGAPHAETLIAAARAAYERDYDDMIDGPQQRYFAQRLQQSIAYDRKLKSPHLGYNGDASDAVVGQWRRQLWGEGPVITIGGVEPD